MDRVKRRELRFHCRRLFLEGSIPHAVIYLYYLTGFYSRRLHINLFLNIFFAFCYRVLSFIGTVGPRGATPLANRSSNHRPRMSNTPPIIFKLLNFYLLIPPNPLVFFFCNIPARWWISHENLENKLWFCHRDLIFDFFLRFCRFVE